MDMQSLLGLRTGQETLKVLPTQVQKEDGSESVDNAVTTNETINATQTVGEEFETFLTLLTAQIRNQDPLAPLDSTQFVEQLATFSSLELQAEGNQVLENISNMLAQALYTNANSPAKLDSAV